MIVLDACALVEIVRQTDRGKGLEALMLKDEAVISCDLVRADAASVFRKIARVEKLSASEAERYLAEGLSVINEFHPLEPLQAEALRESIRYGHSVYDMFYFVLARRTGSTLLTIDKRLMALCEKHGVDCVAEVDL